MASNPPSPQSSDSEFEQIPVGNRNPPGGYLSLFLFGGAICWTVHLLFVAIVAEWGCVSGLGEFRFLGATVIAWSVIVASLLAATLTGWAMVLAVRLSRRLSNTGIKPGHDNSDDERCSSIYLAQVAVWSNGLFLFVIISQTFPILYYLTEC